MNYNAPPSVTESGLFNAQYAKEKEMQGNAYVFRRRWGAFHLGHVGWGFQLEGGQGYYCGATEGRGDVPAIAPGHDNGWWAEQVAEPEQMFDAMRQRQYNDVKILTVLEANPEAAIDRANATGLGGYAAFGNNCLDHVHAILVAYGVQPDEMKRIVGIDDEPNRWFDDLSGGHQNL